MRMLVAVWQILENMSPIVYQNMFNAFNWRQAMNWKCWFAPKVSFQFCSSWKIITMLSSSVWLTSLEWMFQAENIASKWVYSFGFGACICADLMMFSNCRLFTIFSRCATIHVAESKHTPTNWHQSIQLAKYSMLPIGMNVKFGTCTASSSPIIRIFDES